MDYEKKKRLVELRDSMKSYGYMDGVEELEGIFPELKKNEDERIRKWLYDYISNCPNNNFTFYGGVGKDAVLNYLEKQKPAEWSEEDETCLEYALWCVMKTRHFVAKDACDLDACQCAERWLKSLPERFNLPLKQKWSEEDETMFETILSNYKYLSERWVRGEFRTDLGTPSESAIKDSEEELNWLKSLPERCNPHPKQEWSEEDEKMLKAFLHKVEVCDLLTNKENAWIVKKLKSLHPSWTPSEDQIQVIYNVLKSEWGCVTDRACLLGLVHGLEKL